MDGEDSPARATETLRGTLGALPFAEPEIVATPIEIVPGARFQHYELIRELGRGGMGQVWAARDTKLGRRVAMKFVNAQRRAIAERFLAEARATARCNHENIVVIHEVGERDGHPFLVLEHLEGQTVRELLGSFGESAKLPLSRTLELALPIARALRRAHELGIVHFDLKPENVFVTTSGQVKVLDFGIAEAVRGVEPLATDEVRAERTRELRGTLPYMSPAQLRGDAVDARADLWALGVMIFEMLSGRHPLPNCTRQTLVAMSRGEVSPEALRDVAASMPAELLDLVDGLLSRESAITAAEVVTRLEHLLAPRRRQLAEDESPYPGLVAFRESDSDRFFGRERDIARVVARVRRESLTAVVGPSGIGKSSFIHAGVAVAIASPDEEWALVSLRPGRQPLHALAAAISRVAGGGELSLREQPGEAGALLRAHAVATRMRVLVFVDQFEELYTLASDREERRAFTEALAGIADDPSSPLRVVVAMRSDFLDRVAEDPRFMDVVSRGLLFLQAPDREGLRDALVLPIEMAGYRFESPAIVDEIVETLETTLGALPLLQFAGDKLWEARDRTSRLITSESYRAIGGLTGALAAHADRVIAAMAAPAQRLAQRVLRRLVTPERTKAVVEIAELDDLTTDGTEIRRVVDQLVAGRLLVVQKGDGGTTVELVHESLVDSWPALRRWLDEDQGDAAFRAMLAVAAKQWDAKGRPTGLLWTGDAMEEARRWSVRGGEVPARDRAFVDAVLALARRRTRVRRIAGITALAVLVVIAAGATIAALRIRAAQQDLAVQVDATGRALRDAEQRERERDAAEARRTDAERQRTHAEAQQKQAEQRSAIATANKEAADLTIEQQNEELRGKTKRLEDALTTAGRATEQARAATTAAESANDELRRENQRKAAEIERLKNEALTRKLK